MDYAAQAKRAWEYDAYNFWTEHNGAPAAFAREAAENPRQFLRKYAAYFGDVQGCRIANLCGSCAKKALPLALLGAEVTVFDISEANARYAREAANAANVPLAYVVGDAMQIDMRAYGGKFDIAFMEGGVLHYFPDLDGFVGVCRSLLREGGTLILSDFHPINKCFDTLALGNPRTGYFSAEPVECEMAHARFYDEETRAKMPKCALRRYTLSEILNAVIGAGFVLRRFDEHPAWTNPDVPGEFTLIATA